MQKNLTDEEFRLFRKYIDEKCGIDIPSEKAYLIETRLSKILADSGMSSFEALYHAIRSNSDPYVSEKIIDAITTNETLWFRDKTPWKILEDILLPEYVRQFRNNQRQKVRIWSAAASTGQEAYSTAMCISLWLKKNGIKDISLDQFEILATDISGTVLDLAKKGRYDAISIMRGLDSVYKDSFFKKVDSGWEIDKSIKDAVRFQQFNLQNSFMFLGKFDVIFCRYVLIYFSDALKESIFSKLSTSIANDGILFIGASELYSHTEKYFDMLHSNGGTYYKRKVK